MTIALLYRPLRLSATLRDHSWMVEPHDERRWVSLVLRGGRVLGLAVLGYGLLMFGFQRRLAFPGALRDSPRATAAAPPGVRQVWLDTSFGRVEAWFFRAAGGATTPTAVFAHGNGELIEDWRSEMDQLAAAGVNALLVEFPGYGHSDGKPSRASLRETFSSGFDWLRREGGVDAGRIVAYGRSIGGGPASDLATDRPVSALVLQSTFSSATAVAREAYVPGFLVRDRFDNAKAVADFAGPVLLMHGPTDEVIPYGHAERLASVRAGLEINRLDCGHNDCAPQWPSIVASVTAFLSAQGLLE